MGPLSNQSGTVAGVACPLRRPACLRRQSAFTVMELLVAIVVAGLLFGLALPSYRGVVRRQHTAAAIADLGKLGLRIQAYKIQHISPPLSLADIGADDWRDPWGRPYQYLSFEADIPGIKGKIRKDHNLHPINSEFDLYSMGEDGQSRAPLTAKASRDDIVFARDGNFIGPAEDF